jgi:hypothetical protein
VSLRINCQYGTRAAMSLRPLSDSFCKYKGRKPTAIAKTAHPVQGGGVRSTNQARQLSLNSRACQHWPGFQLARCPARSLRGLYQEPGARRLDARPRKVRRPWASQRAQKGCPSTRPILANPARLVVTQSRAIRAAHAPGPRALCWDCSSDRFQCGALPPLPGLVRAPDRTECTGEVPTGYVSSVTTRGRQMGAERPFGQRLLIVSFLVPNLRLQTKRGFSRFVGE